MNSKETGWDDKREKRAKERAEERRTEIKKKFSTSSQPTKKKRK